MKNTVIYFKLIMLFLLFNACGKSEFNDLFKNDLNLSAVINDLKGPLELKNKLISFADEIDSDSCKGDFIFSYYGIPGDSIFLSLIGYHPDIELIEIENFGDTIQNNLHKGFSYRKVFAEQQLGKWLKLKIKSNGIYQTDSLFIPLPMYMWTEPIGYSINPDSSFNFRKTHGFNIRWRQDNHPDNNKGMMFILEYSSVNHDINSSLPPNQKREIYLDYDQGSYTVTPQMLADFPLCPIFHINVIRGDYKMINLGNSKLSIRLYEKTLEGRPLEN